MKNTEAEKSLNFVINTFDKMSNLVDKGTSNFLQTFGSGLIILSLISKIEFFELSIIKLSITEFIAILIVGLILIIMGSYIRFVQYKDQVRMQKDIWKAGEKKLLLSIENQNKDQDSHRKNGENISQNKVNI